MQNNLCCVECTVGPLQYHSAWSAARPRTAAAPSPLELLPINLRHAHPLFNLCEPARHLLFANRHAKMTHPMNRLRLPCGVFKRPDIHPSYGGNAYDDPWRGSIVTMFRLGIPLDTQHIRHMRAIYNFPAMISCMRYIEKYRELGHWQPKLATGNHEAEREVLGQALVRLPLHRVVHPEASIAHVRAFLFNMDPTVAP